MWSCVNCLPVVATGDTQDRALMWASLWLDFFRPMDMVQGHSGGLGPGEGRVGPRLRAICGVKRQPGEAWHCGALSCGSCQAGRRKQVRTEGPGTGAQSQPKWLLHRWAEGLPEGRAGTAEVGGDHG